MLGEPQITQKNMTATRKIGFLHFFEKDAFRDKKELFG